MRALIKKLLGPALLSRLRRVGPFKTELAVPVTDPEELARRRQFYGQFVREGDLVFDVGANVGNRVAPLLTLGARVIAIEPQAECARLLRRRFGDRIEVIEAGLGRQPGRLPLFLSQASTVASFSEDWIEAVRAQRFKELEWNDSTVVEVTTLDALIGRYGVPAFVKIDVEGFELDVLQGLSQPVPCLSYEYTAPEQTWKALECLARLERVSPRAQFNYSEGESMALALDRWQDRASMVATVNSPAFTASAFGDIYCRSS